MEKLKSKRTGNRSSVTRIIRKFEEAKENPDFDRENLLIQYENLKSKKTLLQTINEQILEITEPEDVEAEILNTDEYSDHLELNLRQFRKFLKIDQDQTPRSNTTQSTYEILNVESPSFVPANSTNIVHETTQNATQIQSHNANQPPIPQTSYENSVSDISRVVPHSTLSNHRLPKLTLPKFNGNILNWQTFIESYESAVHLNPSLTNIEKFNYLKSQLEGEALNTIAGFALTTGNYMEAINVLTERYGQPHRVTEAYLQALLNIPSPRYSLSSIRDFYDNCEAYVRGLESLGQSETTYGTLLVPIIMKKLPPDIREHLAREHGPKSWNLKDLRKSILNEIQIMEARQGTDFEDVNRLCPTTSTFYTGTKSPRKNTKKTQNRPIRERPCVFCKEIHAPTYCTKVCDPKERVSIVKRNKLCYNCLGQHYFSECKSNSTCRNCNKKHHSSLCNGFTRTFSETLKHENTKEKRRNENIEEPTSVKLNVVNENEKDETTIFYSTQKRSNVLLKTAVSPVWSGNNYTESNILFDEGAQRSFVTETLAKNLNLKVDGVETLQISAFGKDSTSARELRKATIYIETENKRRIPIEVLVVPTIAVPLQNHIRHVNRNMDYLRGLRLAHPVSEENTFEIAVLIGADYYWDFIGDEIIRGNGPTAVKSKLGYLLSGPLRSGNAKPTDNSSMLNVLLSHKAEEFDLQKFWKLESLGIDSRENDDKEMEYVKEYQNSSIEFYGDRYYAKLPWKPDCDELPSNYYVTKRRTENIEHRKDDLTCENGIHSVIEIERYSSYKKLLRITSYVVRFIDNLKVEKKDRMTGNLKPSEIQRATELWLRNVQQSMFSKEYKILKSGTTVMSKAPRIRQLRLFVDTNDLIRSNGRIHNAELPDTAKFPYILPNDHYLSKLIVLDAHENISHSGVNSTTAYIRQTFWIPAIRQLVRKTLRKCVMCRKAIGKPYSAPEQPPLPKLRLQQAPPFTTTGIDFTGALHVRGKDNKLTKAYICLFTCASTRAIHLEVVPNLSEETFLQAFRRFCSRKSTPKTVMTDNAKTFEAASEEIKRLCESDKLQEAFTKQGIEWIFIPKRAPWFGGWWERLIGLTKTSCPTSKGKD